MLSEIVYLVLTWKSPDYDETGKSLRLTFGDISAWSIEKAREEARAKNDALERQHLKR
ncbi:MAG: hypothetical protein ABI155_02445 [Paralcaligenes sp.]